MVPNLMKEREITFQLKQHAANMQVIWNLCILPYFSYDCDDWNIYEWYEELRKRMFESFVLPPFADDLGKNPEEIEIILRRDFDGDAVWVQRGEKGQASTYEGPYPAKKDIDIFRFIDFFDYEVMGMRKFEYYLVEIRNFPSYPHLVGQRGIVQISSTRAFAV